MKTLTVLFFLGLLLSCGSSSNTEANTIKQGKFGLPITNLTYNTSSNLSGTLVDGFFQFRSNDDITFSYQGLEIATLSADEEISLTQLFDLQSLTQIQILEAIEEFGSAEIEYTKSLKELRTSELIKLLSHFYHLDINQDLSDGIELPATLAISAPTFAYFMRQPPAYILATNSIEAPVIDNISVLNKYIEQGWLNSLLNTYKQTYQYKDMVNTFDYNHDTTYEYIYDSDDNLVTTIVSDQVDNTSYTIDREYDNGLLTKVSTDLDSTEYKYTNGILVETIITDSNLQKSISNHDIYGNILQTNVFSANDTTTPTSSTRNTIENGLIVQSVREDTQGNKTVTDREYSLGLRSSIKVNTQDMQTLLSFSFLYNDYGLPSFEEQVYPDQTIKKNNEYNTWNLIKSSSQEIISGNTVLAGSLDYFYNEFNQLERVENSLLTSPLEVFSYEWDADQLVKYQYIARNPYQEINYKYSQGLIESTTYQSTYEGDDVIISIYSNEYEHSNKLHQLPSQVIELQDYCSPLPIQC
ncbi:hypothetical protein [Kangiella sp. HZ709]|uniref:hypothetical protein n=1 Tax=Kangiella sp. HZ709 TaxID=2666328 RepID=UPI0012AF8612|nr:hypothetical protein [Kangiella sp. HZ709]MRX26661.1 hypothetical protein [Kangiella sp. HZ709]